MMIHFSLTSTEGLPSPGLLVSVLTHQNYSLPKDNMVSLVLSALISQLAFISKISLSLTVLQTIFK